MRLFISEKNVFRDGKIGNERQFLMDYDNTELFAFADITEAAFLAVKKDFSVITSMGIHSAEYIHQGRLSRSVFAHQRVDLMIYNGQTDIFQGAYAGKILGYVLHFQKCFSHELRLACVKGPGTFRVLLF